MSGVQALEADAIIGERYRLRRPLGEGGMGWVWEAKHVFTQKPFALKFLKGAKAEDRRRFVREVRAAAAVKHPNVIGVHDFVELPSGTLVMVMDLLHGETLGQILRREGRIAIGSLAAMLLPVVSALEAAHAVGIVHRDLKPDNIFLAETEDAGIVVKVLDFGVAKLTAVEGLAARTQALTGTGSMVGTPYYMAPEQVVSEKDLDARADIWSLGVVMYECLAGVRPTEADNVGRVLKRIILADFAPIKTLCEDLPEDVAALVMKMLVGDRDARVRELGDVAAVLRRHASASIPASARVPTGEDEAVDVHAETVSATSNGEGSRGETNEAVTMPLVRSTRTRNGLIAAVAAAALAGVSIYGFGLPSQKAAPESASLTMPLPAPTPSQAAPGTPASGARPEPTPVPSASASATSIASVMASAPAVPRATPTLRTPNTPPRPAVGATGAAVAAAAVPAAPPISAAVAPPPVPHTSAAVQPSAKPPLGFAAGPKE